MPSAGTLAPKPALPAAVWIRPGSAATAFCSSAGDSVSSVAQAPSVARLLLPMVNRLPAGSLGDEPQLSCSVYGPVVTSGEAIGSVTAAVPVIAVVSSVVTGAVRSFAVM